MLKPSEIRELIKTLRIAQNPFKREDRLYAIEHRNASDARRDLLYINMNLVWHLIERGHLEESKRGIGISEKGSSFLEEYGNKIKVLGKKKVGVKLESVRGNIDYRIWTPEDEKRKSSMIPYMEEQRRKIKYIATSLQTSNFNVLENPEIKKSIDNLYKELKARED